MGVFVIEVGVTVGVSVGSIPMLLKPTFTAEAAKQSVQHPIINKSQSGIANLQILIGCFNKPVCSSFSLFSVSES
jgi:hypothetical protein